MCIPFFGFRGRERPATPVVVWTGQMSGSGTNVAFGRVISKEPTKVSPAVQDGEDLRFTFEAPGSKQIDGEKPYWMQGDAAFETEEALAMRAALKHDARVRAELQKFWRVYDKDQSGNVSKAEYLNVHAKLCLVLIPDITPAEARRAGEEDWVSDAGGSDLMSCEQLFDCLFELADMWCTGISVEEYANFLRKLFKRVTVKSVTKSSGVVVTEKPTAPSEVRSSRPHRSSSRPHSRSTYPPTLYLV